jgi:hypothetical protein
MNRSTLEALIAGRKIVGYGAGLAFLGAQETWRLPVAYVVDQNERFHGQTIQGVPIAAVSKLAAEAKDDVFVVVYATGAATVLAISRQLNALGLREREHYLDVSHFHFCSMGERLEKLFGVELSYDDFLRARALSLYAGPKSQSTISGTWAFTVLAEHVLHSVRGDVAELGVYNGGNAFAALLASPQLRSRSYRLLDSFEGFPELSERDPSSWQNDFAGVDYRSLVDMFAHFPKVELHKGFFAQTFPRLPDAKYALIYVDCDLYQSTLECLEYFHERMPHGAVLYFHDYWLPRDPLPAGARDVFTGLRAAVDEFFGANGPRIEVFPETTHALIVKR